MARRLWQRAWVQVSVVALLSALVTGAVALALRPESRPAAPTPSGRVEPVTRISSTLKSRFKIFREAARGSDRASVGSASGTPNGQAPDPDAEAGYVRENGLNVALGRRLRRFPRVFAIPAPGAVCLVFARAGGACTPEAFAGRDFQVQACGHLPRGAFAVSGLVTDVTRAAFLRLRNGRRVPLSISRNYVTVTRRAADRGQLPATVELEDARGVRRHNVPRMRFADLACAVGQQPRGRP